MADLVVWENDMALEKYPPIPYVFWSESAVRKYLTLKGFDFTKMNRIVKIEDWEGARWIQHG